MGKYHIPVILENFIDLTQAFMYNGRMATTLIGSSLKV